MSVILYGWGPAFNCPSPSPFVMKSHMQLQMLGVEFTCDWADLDSVPKHKAPYVRDNGALIEDSNFIRWHFEKKLSKTLFDGLTEEQKALSWAMERMAEGHLYMASMNERWLNDENFNKGPMMFFMDVPEEARAQVSKEVRDGIRDGLIGQGFGRHSHDEQMALADRDIEAVARLLGDKDFLLGDWPTAIDAGVAPAIIAASTTYFDTPLSALVQRHENLTGYCERIKATFFAENKWPMPVMAA